MIATIQLRRSPAATWTLDNPVLFQGEVGVETDTNKAKIGDGVTGWNSLPYWNTGGVAGSVSSVFGRTGAVVAQTGDYTAAQVSALAIANNLTDVSNRQTALNNLSGAVTTGQFLRGNGTNVLMSAIQTSDVPQLSNYAPTGLTGATAATAYAGGTVFGHPLSGTWSAGQWVVDQSGHIYVCVVGGTPGTWRRVSQDPWQFFLEDYAKCDGKQTLVSVTSGSATINTTPLATPGTPSPTTATTGGTIAAGVYGVKVTFVNRWGETVASANGNVTTTGSTSTITIPSPAATGNATGWYAYVTQVNGATYTRQQGAGSPTPIQVPLVLTAPPTSSGANPPGSDTSAAQIFTSTAVDGGKNAMINGGLGTPGGPWVGTIVTVNSPTQAVISDTTISVTQTGLAMVFSSDDRVAVDQCMQDAHTYALANNNFFQVIGPNKIIGLGANFFQSQTGVSSGATYTYNAQVRLAQGQPSNQMEKLEGQLIGPSDNAHAEFWVSQLPNLTGLTFVSYSVGPTSADPTFGQQSVLGCPSAGVNNNGSVGFLNMKIVLNGVNVYHPGWFNGIGIDLQTIAGIRLRCRVAAYAPSTTIGGGVNPSNGWLTNTFFQQKIGMAIRFPNEGNNDDCVVDSLTVEGQTLCFTSGCDHLVINRLLTINAYHGWLTTAVDANVHDLTINQWSVENLLGSIFKTTGSAGRLRLNVVFDGENSGPVWDINDVGNILYGDLYWGDAFRPNSGPANVPVPSINGAVNLQVHNRMILRQVYGAPTYTLGTALQNPWWEDMWISLSGGTTTGILIGPTSATATTSVGTTTPVSFRLPAGWWVNIQGSVKPTTFIAVPH